MAKLNVYASANRVTLVPLVLRESLVPRESL